MHRVIKYSQVVNERPQELIFSKVKAFHGSVDNGLLEIEYREKRLKAQMLISEAIEKASHILAKARQDADEILKTTNAQLEELKAEAEKEGFQKGFDAGKEAGLERFNAAIEKLKDTECAWLNERKKLIKNTEKDMVELVLSIAEKVLQNALAVKPEIVLDLVKNGLDKFRDEESLIIRAGEQDYETLTANMPFLKKFVNEAVNLGVVLDPSLKPGEPVIESATGKVYPGITRQLEEIKKEVLGG